MAVGAGCFWLAIVFVILGIVAIFSRNNPPLGWFLVASALFVAGVVFLHKSYRKASAIGCVVSLLVCVFIVVAHYQRQSEYKRYQQLQQMREARQQEQLTRRSLNDVTTKPTGATHARATDN